MSAVSVIPASVLSLILLVPSIQAQEAINGVLGDTVKDSRYGSLQVGPTHTQRDVMQSVLRVTIPEQVVTVGEAIKYLLKPYGYQLEDKRDESERLYFYILLTRPLPEPHRTLDLITLHDALMVLGGESFELAINPVLRTISYHLKPGLNDYVSEESIDDAKDIWRKSAAHVLNASTEESPPIDVLDYGPVKSGDTLSDIVLQLGLADLTLEQTLVHTFLSNPDAFANGNMNHLLVGTYLSVPPPGDEPLPPVAARRIVDEHYRRWLQQVQP